MMRVLIADDEVHICSLLKYLIKWEELGLTLAGTFSTGTEVLEYLREDSAEILICDIEMPDMNGIELMEAISQKERAMKIIVISGFRNFDYARSAIQYGAVNYLLKPVNEKELNDVLREVVLSTKADIRQDAVMLRAASRMNFMGQVVRQEIHEPLQQINRNYEYQFTDGKFCMLYAVFPGISPDSDDVRVVKRMFGEILRPALNEFCNEVEFFDEEKNSIYILLNYEREKEDMVQNTLENILHNSIVEMGCKTQNEVYIGIGNAVDQIDGLTGSALKAKRASCERFYRKGKRIFTVRSTGNADERSEMLTMDDKQEFCRLIELIQPEGLKEYTEKIFRKNFMNFRTAPYLLLTCCSTLLKLFTDTLEQAGSVWKDREAFIRESEFALESCKDAEEVRNTLTGCILKEMEQRLSEKMENAVVYVQQAKNYIETHYMEDITLKVLAEHININASYLSAVFKNETGMNYSKYLTMVRMEKAKELLRQCRLNLTQIARATGYNRTSYFSNQFKIYTGIKPAEYQRLHQNKLGDFK